MVGKEPDLSTENLNAMTANLTTRVRVVPPMPETQKRVESAIVSKLVDVARRRGKPLMHVKLSKNLLRGAIRKAQREQVRAGLKGTGRSLDLIYTEDAEHQRVGAKQIRVDFKAAQPTMTALNTSIQESNDGEARSVERASQIVPFVSAGTPIPPSSKSMTAGGVLKETPANRALKVCPTPNEIFARLGPSSYYSDSRAVLLNSDVRVGLRALMDAGVKVDCIVTSPPYYGQRDYGIAGQIGQEDHPSEFVEKLLEIFELCGNVLSDTGSLWVNIGDTYWSGKGAHKSAESKQGARRFGIRPQDKPGDGRWARPKQLLLLPHRIAIGMQERGWLVRNDNVWVKPNPVPDQVRDRCSISHEYVFHFTKSRWYYFDRMPVGRRNKSGSVLPPVDTWIVPPSTGNGRHRASFSVELIRIPVLTTTPPNGIVLDPFNGSGTTTAFAKSEGFRTVGIELSDVYCRDAADLLRKVQTTRPQMA